MLPVVAIVPAGIEAGAEVNQNAFAFVDIESGSATSLEAASKRDTVTFIAGSNVTMTASPGNNIVTINAADTTYSNATTSASGLMSAADKTKLNGIAAGAQVNPGVATTSANGLMSSTDKTKLNNITIRTAAAVATKNFTIDYRETVKVVFKYKYTEDRFDDADIVVPMTIPQLSTGLAINSFEHSGAYFNIWITNAHPTSRTVTANTEIKLLVIDNEVS